MDKKRLQGEILSDAFLKPEEIFSGKAEWKMLK